MNGARGGALSMLDAVARRLFGAERQRAVGSRRPGGAGLSGSLRGR